MTLTATQPLFDLGQRRARVAEIRAEVQSDLSRLAKDRNALLRAGLLATLAADNARRLIAVHEDRIADFGSMQKTAQRLADINVLSDADVRLAEVKAQEGAVDLASARNEAARAARSWARVAAGHEMPRNLDPRALRAAAGVATLDDAIRVASTRNHELRALASLDTRLAAEMHSLSLANLPTINAATVGTVDGSEVDAAAGLSVAVSLYDQDIRICAARPSVTVRRCAFSLRPPNAMWC